MSLLLRTVLLTGLQGIGAGSHAASLHNDPSESRAGGFSAKVLITADAHWQDKWNTPPEVAPNFIPAGAVKMTDPVWVLVFFHGAGMDAKGAVHLSCDYTVTGPDGVVELEKAGVKCFDDRVRDARLVYLSPVVLTMTSEPGDAAGPHRVKVVVHDQVSGAQVSVQSGYARIAR